MNPTPKQCNGWYLEACKRVNESTTTDLLHVNAVMHIVCELAARWGAEQQVMRLAQGVSVEPNGYDPLSDQYLYKQDTLQTAIAAARVAALEEAANVCDRQAIPNAVFLAEKVRALINTNLTTGEMK